jgi:hypothetical protein
MTWEARLLYREVMDEIWLHGSVPTKVEELAEIAKMPLEVVVRVWPQVHDCLVPSKKNPDELTSERMEEERCRRNKVKKMRAKLGRIGGLESAKQRRSKAEAIASGLLKQIEPTQDKTRQVSTRRPNAAYEMFRQAYDKHQAPDRYKGAKKDFVQLAALEQRLDLNGEPIPNWETAIKNYFLTPRAPRSLADLAANYGTFVQYPLDRYGKPCSGRKGNGRNSGVSGMSKLNKLINRKMWQEIAEEGEGRDLAKVMFIDWRDRYTAKLCEYIRLYGDAKLYGTPMATPYRSMEWCNAAVDLLTHAPEDIQSQFMLLSESDKDRWIAAVLEDGGVADLNGHFHELFA